jgi:hypothetical protein
MTTCVEQQLAERPYRDAVGSSLDPPIWLETSTLDDYAIAVALSVASAGAVGWAPILGRAPPSREPRFMLHDALRDGSLVDLTRWRMAQHTWFRWAAPLGAVLPMHWYIYAHLGLGRPRDETAAARDALAQDYATRGPSSRAALVQHTLRRKAHVGTFVTSSGDPRGAWPAMLLAERLDLPFAFFDCEAERAMAFDEAAKVIMCRVGEPEPAAPNVDVLAAASLEELTWLVVRQARAQTRGTPPPYAPPIARVRDRALYDWEALEAQDRRALLIRLEERFAILGPVDFDFAGHSIDNERGLALVREAMDLEPRLWSQQQLLALTTLRLWDTADIGFTELNQSDVDFAVLDAFFCEKERRYAELAPDYGRTLQPTLLERAEGVRRRRTAIEACHVRCFSVDGASWVRGEHFIRAERVATDDIPDALAEHVARRVGVELDREGPHPRPFASLVERMIRRGTNPAEALVALADYAAFDPELKADYAILTAARGVKLDQPWTMKLQDVFSYAAVRPEFDHKSRGVRLDVTRIQNSICQRMRYNVTCRAKNYSPSREDRLLAQPFQYPDIAAMEDAHHPGHIAAGIRFANRSPFTLEVEINGHTRSWRGLADFRANRASHRDEDRFTVDDQPIVIRYAWWSKAIVEAAYRAGVALDEKYCIKRSEGQGRGS